MEKEIEELWKSHGYPGAQRLWSIVKGKVSGVKLKDVQEFVANQETAQLHKKAPVDTKSNHITSSANQHDYQADLLDLAKYGKSNGGNNWCLLVEDIFNRKAFAAPLKTKSPNDVLPALNKAFEVMGKPQLTLKTDQGGEFKGVVGKKLKELHIVHHTAEVGDHRVLGMIDSLCRFFKNAIHRHFTQTQSTNWIDYLPTLVQSYNNTPHSSLKGMSPVEAERKETVTRNLTYNMVTRDKREPKFAVGDTVRVLKRKMTFDRGYETKWSIQRFTIEAIDGLYYVLSNGKRYREHQLTKVKPAMEEKKVAVEEEKKEEAVVETRAPLAPGRARSPTPERKAPEKSEEGRFDVARQAKFDKKTADILKFKEGVSASNRREGLRERKVNQLEHARYGKVKW